MQKNKDNIIIDLTFGFAREIISYTELLEGVKRYNLANQLFRSGASIGANVREAQNAESKSDFVHKMKIAAKEADETEYWLLLCYAHATYPECEPLLKKIETIQKVLSKIIATSKASSNYQISKSSN